MSWLSNESESYFDDLRERLRHEVQHGRFGEAIALCDQAVEWAGERDDAAGADLARCNRCGVLITLGRGDEEAPGMRRILLGSTHSVNCFLAAYNLSRIHESKRETDRGLFYARLALGHAEKAERTDLLGTVYNQLGGLQTIDCRFDEACDSYSQALSLAPPDPDRSIMESNIGFCRVLLGEHREGFRWLFRSLRGMRRRGIEGWEALPRLGLCYAYLDLGKLAAARRHADRGLQVAERSEMSEQILNALYLLGEVEKQLGNELAAYECFQRLQRDYYPEEPFISDFLMTADVRRLVNLMA